MRLLDNIKKVRDVLSDESKWTQGRYAVDKDNVFIATTHSAACKWCLTGAIWRVARDMKEQNEIVDYLKHKINYRRLSEFNDAEDTKYQDIVNLLDTAIESISVES